MNDDFLNEYYQPSPRAFAQELFERISKQKPSLLVGTLPVRNVLFLLATIAIIVACVRAATAPRWTNIGGIWVDVGAKYEIGLIIPKTSSGSITNSGFGYGNQFTFCGQDCVSLSEAEQTCDCILQIPSWAPDQFNWNGKVNPYWVSDGGQIQWIHSGNQSSITLFFVPLKFWNGAQRLSYDPFTDSAVPGSYRVVKVNGQPAVLIHGLWTVPYKASPSITDFSNPTWDKNVGLSLYWVANEVEYRLFTYSNNVSAQDLIRVAESSR